MMSFKTFLICVFSLLIVAAEEPLANLERALRLNLFHNYSHKIIPIVKDGTPITFNVSMMLLQITQVNPKENTLTTQGWLTLGWEDYRFQWDPSEYGGIKDIRVSDNEVWHPDIKLFNSASPENFGRTLSLAFPYGTALWVPPFTFTSRCEIDLDKYPFDEHNCTIVLGSWTYSAYQLNIINNGVAFDYYSSSNEWDLVKSTYWKTTRFYPEAGDLPYSDVSFSFLLKRKTNDFYISTFGPIIVAIILALLILLLPPKSSSKLFLGFISLWLLNSVTSRLSYALASATRGTPKILWFCGISTYLVTAIIVISSLSLVFVNEKRKFSTPYWFKKWKSMNLFHQLVNENDNKCDNRLTDEEIAKPQVDETSNCFAIANRIFFLFFVILFTVCSLLTFL